MGRRTWKYTISIYFNIFFYSFTLLMLLNINNLDKDAHLREEYRVNNNNT